MFFPGQDDRTPLKAFNYQHPGEIIFGNGRISEVGSIVSRYGQRCLIVSGPHNGALRDLYPIVGELLEHLGMEWKHFDGVNSNPTADLISTGAKLARQFQADVILAIGGGSSLDSREGDIPGDNTSRNVLGLRLFQTATFRAHTAGRRCRHHRGIWIAGQPGGDHPLSQFPREIRPLQRSLDPKSGNY